MRANWGVCIIVVAVVSGCTGGNFAKGSQYQWAVHDMNRPQPRIITAAETMGELPSDVVVLFDGKDLSQWVCTKDGGPARWKVRNGYTEVVKKGGSIRTKRSFGSCQLHIEWATPMRIVGSGQDRGNSGVPLMSRYEVQVLDSYENKTYPDGQAGAIYGQYPPMVNASRPPGEWQSYDIIFHRPIFKNGKVVRPASITVLYNGVVVQDNVEILGTTAHKKRAQYEVHADKLPIMLQDHGNAVRYRNIWIRELAD